MKDDLFGEAPNPERCDGCGGMFDASELKRCRNCGRYFCSECRKTHDCRTEIGESKLTDSVVAAATEKEISEPRLLQDTEMPDIISVNEDAHIQERTLTPLQPSDPKSKQDSPEYLLISVPDKQVQESPRPVSEQETVTEPVAPDKKRCDGCGRLFDAAKLKQCKNCGEYFCLECRKTHDCRITPNRERRTAIIPPEETQIRPRSNPVSGPSKEPVVPIPAEPKAESSHRVVSDPGRNEIPDVPMPAAPSAKPKAESSHRVVSEPGTNEMPDVPMPAAPSAEPMHKVVPKPGTDEELRYSSEILCDDCGKYYDITQMRRCIECDALLCPTCRETHICRKKQEMREPSHVSEPAEPILLRKQTTPPVIKTRDDLLDEIGLPKSSDKSESRQSEFHTGTASEIRLQDDFSLGVPYRQSYVPPVAKNEESLQIHETKTVADDEMRCERCGKLYKKSELRRCHKCGVILCPECRKHHRCSKKWI